MVTSLIDLAKGSSDAAVLINKTLPENERFWGRFESKLKNDPDVPWATIRSRSYLQPKFVAVSCELIHGFDGSRASMKAHFDSFVEPPADGRYAKQELVARIMVVAEKAATEAAPSDRLAGLAGRRLVEERMAAAVEELLRELGPLRPELQEIGRNVETVIEQIRLQDETQARLAHGLEESLGRLTDAVEKQATQASMSSPGSIDRAEMEKLLEAQADKIQQQNEDLFTRMYQHSHDAVGGRQLGSGAGMTVEQSPLTPEPETASATASDREYHAQLELLGRTDQAAAARLERAYREGAVSLAAAVREDTFDDGITDLLVAAARILAKTVFLAEAETAFLVAARLTDDPRDKARQLTRASGLAALQGAPERSGRHLDGARRLVPDHPAVLIAEARASADSQFALEHLAGVEPENDRERAVLHQTRAQALLHQGDEDDAREEFALAKQADAGNEMVVEFGAVLSMAAAHRRLKEGEAVDPVPLREAASVFEDLAAEIGGQGRLDEAAQLLARAAEALLIAHEPGEAARVLRSVVDPRSLKLESVLYLGEVAGMAGRPDLVLELVPADADATPARLLRADAEAQGEDPQDRSSAVRVLKGLLDDADANIARRAAFAVLAASVEFEDVAWDEAAAAIVAAEKADVEVAMRAERALLLGNPGEAQRILLPQAGNTVALRRLRDYAALAGEWEKAKDRSRELIRRERDPRDRLALAETFRKLNERSDAEREFTALAGDASLAAEIRESAFRALAEIPGANRDYEAIRAVSQEWHEALPASPNAMWNLMFALARLSRHADAWTIAQTANLIADTEPRAALYGEILSRAAPRADALKRLIEISDRFGRRVEAVEALIITTSLDAEAENLAFDDGTERRVRETFATFSKRFPESRMIRSMPAPQTPEEIANFFTTLAGNTPQLQHEIGEAIVAGRAPVNALAALSSGSIGKTWSRLRALPIGFGMEERDGADREAAREALGGAAVWDSSSLFVVLGLGEQIADAIRASLPGSTVVTETLEDVDGDMRAPGKPSGETLHTPAGDFGVRDIPAEEVAQERRRAEQALLAVKLFEVQPALGADADSDLSREYKSSESGPEFRAVFGTLLLAQRTGRPVFSDDRFIREVARSFGLKTFGTLALLDIMAEDGIITAEARKAARRNLAAIGAWGVGLARDELIVVGVEDGFALTRTTAGALRDRARWRANPSLAWLEVLPFLLAAHAQSPDAFRGWVLRALDSAQTSFPEMGRAWSVEIMLVVAWSQAVAEEVPDEFFQALVEEAKRLPWWLTETGYDPVLGPLSKMLTLVGVSDVHERFGIFRLLVPRLRASDQFRAVLAFAHVWQA
jgi:tetratricopeptide (TPR) repeat protein